MVRRKPVISLKIEVFVSFTGHRRFEKHSAAAISQAVCVIGLGHSEPQDGFEVDLEDQAKTQSTETTKPKKRRTSIGMGSPNKVFSGVLGALFAVGCVGLNGLQVQAEDGAKSPLSVITPWARATPGGVTIGAAYLKIKSTSASGDRLVGAMSPRSGRVELHTHSVENGVTKMRKVDGFDLGKDRPLVMAPGGHHIMLFDLKAPLKAGEMLPLTLTFEKAGAITVEAKVAPVGAKGPTANEARGSGSEHHGH